MPDVGFFELLLVWGFGVFCGALTSHLGRRWARRMFTEMDAEIRRESGRGVEYPEGSDD